MKLLKNERHNKSFLNKTMMGPNALLLIDELTQSLKIEKGMRILDLGCGMGLTSIFLAEEFDVTVFAADLWIDPSENNARIKQFGLDNRVIPLNLEANNLPLPFANQYFDMVISIDAYHYFGAKPGYLERHLAPLVKKGGTIAVVVPGLKHELANGVPPELAPFWVDNMGLYTCEFWQNLWQESDAVSIERCTDMACYRQSWEDWLACDNPYAVRDVDMMKAEAGNYFNFVQIIGKVK